MMRWLLIALVKGYRLLLSPWLGSSCRFQPTCSAYSLQALTQHGAAGGTWLTLGRLARCHPWCHGGHDPVPPDPPRATRLFSRLLSQAQATATAKAKAKAPSSSSPKKSP